MPRENTENLLLPPRSNVENIYSIPRTWPSRGPTSSSLASSSSALCSTLSSSSCSLLNLLCRVLGCAEIADYPALSVDRAGGGNPLYAEDTPNQEFLIWCAPIQEFLIRCTPIQEFEFTDSVLVFVRGVIWHQEGYYCYIISQMNTCIIKKILPKMCLALLRACRYL